MFREIEPLKTPTRILSDVSDTFDNLGKKLAGEPASTVTQHVPLDPQSAATTPRRPPSVLSMSPNVASPLLLDGIQAEERRLHKYIVPITEAHPPNPKTVAVEQTMQGLREEMQATERQLWAKRGLLEQCEVLQRRKLIEDALEIEIKTHLETVKAQAKRSRDRLDQQFFELQNLLTSRRAVLLEQINQNEQTRCEGLEGSIAECKERGQNIDGMLNTIQQAALGDQNLSAMVEHISTALNGDALVVNSCDLTPFDMSLDAAPAQEAINMLHFIQHPNAAAAAAHFAKLYGTESMEDEEPEEEEKPGSDEEGWVTERTISSSSPYASPQYAAKQAVRSVLDAPDVPTNLTVQHIPAISQEPQVFRVTWDPVDSATSYLLERESGSGECFAEYFGPLTQADLELASSGDKVRVRADNALASSEWCQEVICMRGCTSPADNDFIEHPYPRTQDPVQEASRSLIAQAASHGNVGTYPSPSN